MASIEKRLEMAEAAGFTYQIRQSDPETPPLILLHGSGGTEADLLDLAEAISPKATCIALRGGVPWDDGFAFFRRNADRTLDRDDLAARTTDLCKFIGYAMTHHNLQRPPILVGYSNGAIVAAAAVCRGAELTSGAILLRPLSPAPDQEFPPLKDYPVLILGGRYDSRRHPNDAPLIAAQFRCSGARVTCHLLPTGHGWRESGLDIALAKSWLESGLFKSRLSDRLQKS
jgi:phospholipase/carboxylesterase